MAKTSRCVWLVGIVTLQVSALPLRAEGDRCVHVATCPEDKVDGRGCCLAVPNVSGPITIVLPQPPSLTLGCPRDMVRVPGSVFSMGSRAGDGDQDESPPHRVKLDGYCIDKTEVQVAAYAACVAAGRCTPTPTSSSSGLERYCNEARADRQQHPINCVNWEQALTYCASAGKRLPSEAEWEYAAVGANGQRYPWGNEPPSAARLNACGSECRPLRKQLNLEPAVMYDASDTWETTAPVRSFPSAASPAGAFDMDGNVAEWTNDWYGSYAGTASTFQDGPHRVVRGGSFLETDAARVRGASRWSASPSNYAVNVGFRCAR